MEGDQVIIPVLNSHPSLLSPPQALKEQQTDNSSGVVTGNAVGDVGGEIEGDGG